MHAISLLWRSLRAYGALGKGVWCEAGGASLTPDTLTQGELASQSDAKEAFEKPCLNIPILYT
ncbi:hypothetical protein KSD_27570 [Ktedonobacter sp. SOSP1-85]|nr:hypothetical protein KSD_27570 [Ktedonobacter sp. SOSP1-85]